MLGVTVGRDVYGDDIERVSDLVCTVS